LRPAPAEIFVSQSGSEYRSPDATICEFRRAAAETPRWIQIWRYSMPIYIQFSAKGRSLGRGKGKVHGMSYGSNVITPRNLDSSLFQIASEFSQPKGSSSGGRHHSPIVIVKEVDAASPLLWQALCTNEVFQSADLSFARPSGNGGKEEVVATITLTNAVISQVGQFHPGQFPGPKKPKHGLPSQQIDTNELEEIKFTFQKITYTNVLGKKGASDDWLGG
jgi:type VI secretion system secreted protein Hcp